MSSRRAVLTLLVLSAGVTPVPAQVFGTFPWQMQPYCNIVTLTLTSSPAGFVLDGADDQCGAVNKASAVGAASFSTTGNVTFNFTIVTAPGGKATHVSAIVSPATGSGTWTDSVGNTGTFAFFGHTPGLPVRPFPASGIGAGTVTAAEIAPGAVGAAQLALNAVTGAAVADGSLTMADVSNGPRLVVTSPTSLVAVSTSPTVVSTLTMTAPAAGQILVNATGTFYFYGATVEQDGARCSLTPTTAEDVSNYFFGTDGGSTVPAGDAFGAQRVFAVTAGPFSVNLVCVRSSGPSTFVWNATLSGLFVAQ